MGIPEIDFLRRQLRKDPNQFLQFTDANDHMLHVKRGSIVAFAYGKSTYGKDKNCWLLLENGAPFELHNTETFESVKDRILGPEFVPEESDAQ
jgi:hypothetical protein